MSSSAALRNVAARLLPLMIPAAFWLGERSTRSKRIPVREIPRAPALVCTHSSTEPDSESPKPLDFIVGKLHPTDAKGIVEFSHPYASAPMAPIAQGLLRVHKNLRITYLRHDGDFGIYWLELPDGVSAETVMDVLSSLLCKLNTLDAEILAAFQLISAVMSPEPERDMNEVRRRIGQFQKLNLL